MNATMEALEKLKAECREAYDAAAVVGRWVWVTFQGAPKPDTRRFLKENGYRWNRKREVWQNPCGYHTRGAPYDPRMKYGSVPAAELTV